MVIQLGDIPKTSNYAFRKIEEIIGKKVINIPPHPKGKKKEKRKRN